MKNNHSASAAFKEKKSVSIAALIVCFLVACGIWLYAQATNDDIYTKNYNQIPVVVDQASLDEFNQSHPDLNFDSLSIQFASVAIRGTNRDLAKIDAQNIRLSVDVRTAVDGVVTIKAFLIGDGTNGDKVEIKDYDITPAVATVNVSKKVDCVVDMLPAVVEKVDADNNVSKFDLSLVEEQISLDVIGTIQEVSKIDSVKIRLDLLNFDPTINGHQQIAVTSVSFLDENGEELFNNSNLVDGIRYTLPTIMVNVAPVDIGITDGSTDGKS
ncbi:MAG: hypothetical protein J6R46_08680 [Clostridia bacterium]|jgi:hypothetical protein|nr:hypothetical protein [Clostridia bacterium]